MRISSIFSSRTLATFVVGFLTVACAGIGVGEWFCRARVAHWDPQAQRAEQIYIGTAHDAVLGDSQAFHGFREYSSIYWETPRQPLAFEMLGLSGESGFVLATLAEQYFRFRKPGRVILAGGPQMFAQI